MIIACTACPAQYSIADAKIRGRKVRITCKHCGAGIVVDATSASTAARVGDGLSFRALERPAPSPSPDADGEATRLAGKGQVPSVQDAPTVSRAVAPETLQAEQQSGKATLPPPTQAPPPPPDAVDNTVIASPQAIRKSLHSLPPQPSAEVKTLLSASHPDVRGGRRVVWPLLVTTTAVLLALWALLERR